LSSIKVAEAAAVFFHMSIARQPIQYFTSLKEKEGFLQKTIQEPISESTRRRN
jgi:hypothetical protein